MPCAPVAPSSGSFDFGFHQPDISTCDASTGVKPACSGLLSSALATSLEDMPQGSCCSKQGEGHMEQTWTPPAAISTFSEALAGPIDNHLSKKK